MVCTVLIPIPVSTVTIYAPNYSIVNANIDCDRKFTRQALICAHNLHHYRKAVPTEIEINTNHLLHPRMFCPEDGAAWNHYKTGIKETLSQCIHVDVRETYKLYKDYCSNTNMTGITVNPILQFAMHIWSRHMGVPLVFDDTGLPSMMIEKLPGPFLVKTADIEMHSGTWNCSHGLFQCHDGTCLLDIQVCNGKYECMDHSDELESVCHAVCIHLRQEKFVSIKNARIHYRSRFSWVHILRCFSSCSEKVPFGKIYKR